ncbi:disulfide bond formation protein B [Acidisoma cellulosilytica]|uniref:Disulfide bond formation protein B n=1 Tax=Acidisoma cellulosilyticum TaxID=2802395 RepID=A0A963Z8K8_9PROT|nr:disulfide bond formation protein B [Acidisoma cellulosilyticum]MCB8883857.1 disulfide bond formation protein B [Acidisoma cellulosilyticum]
MARLYVLANVATAWCLALVLLAAFAAQFLSGEPPCPLCLMQRIAMMMAALGPLSVLVASARGALSSREIAVGASIAILASLLGACIATRQVLLHILPGDPGFGAPMLGYHLYTWCLVVFVCTILAAALQLCGLTWFQGQAQGAPAIARVTALLLGLVIVGNILSVIAEAGFAWHLPDNPTRYLLF